MKGSYGQWALTPAGVAKVTELEALAKGSPNLTARFFDKRLKESKKELFTVLRRAISSSMPLSVSCSLIDDHIQNCLLRLISRDALRGRILRGLPIENHHIAQWAIRSAYTDARNDGTEPLTRERHGAKTERERSKTYPEISVTAASPVKVLFNLEGEDTEASWVDFIDTESPLRTEVAERDLAFDTLWKRVEHVVQKKSASGQRYMGIIKMKMDGFTVQEMAAGLNVSKHRAATLLAEARRVARSAWQEMNRGMLLEGECHG